MARLIRCDRCGEEFKADSGNIGTIEIPVLNALDVSTDRATRDLCHSCIKLLWKFMNLSRLAK